MVVDLDFHKVIRYFLYIIFFTFISSNSFSNDFNFKKIADLDDPWGSSFINKDELLVTEKSGKIKIINILSKEIFEVKHNLDFLVVVKVGC